MLSPVSVSANQHEYEFGNSGISYNNIFVHLLWTPAEAANEYKLTWQVNIQLAKNNENWVVKVDAQKGNMVTKGKYYGK